MNKFGILHNLDDSLVELEYLADRFEWDAEEVAVLRAQVKLMNAIREVEKAQYDEETQDLDQQLDEVHLNYLQTTGDLSIANARISELETDIGVFEAKLATTEQLDEGSEPGVYEVGDRICDEYDGPGTVTDVDHANRTCRVVFDNDHSGFSPTPVSFRHISMLLDEDEKERFSSELVLHKKEEEEMDDFFGGGLMFD